MIFKLRIIVITTKLLYKLILVRNVLMSCWVCYIGVALGVLFCMHLIIKPILISIDRSLEYMVVYDDTVILSVLVFSVDVEDFIMEPLERSDIMFLL